jgi:formate-dependent nitrite reductase cytochrome c552 subunit
VHEKAGVDCSDCHYGEKIVKGKTYSSHQTALPLLKTKETCLKSGCHGADSSYKWDEATAQYLIKITQQLQRKRLADLEVGVNKLALAIVDAKKSGVDAAAITKAQDAYSDVSFVATFWLKEYSGGFHNPDLSETTLMRAYGECNAALAELAKAAK